MPLPPWLDGALIDSVATVSGKPKYWPLATFALVFLAVGIAGLLLDPGFPEPSPRGVPMGWVYGAIAASSLLLLGLADYLKWVRRG